MMSDFQSGSLRASLIAWEAEIAVYWDSLIRSPEFLQRVGYQLTRSLQSQQHVSQVWEQAFLQAALESQEAARLLYLLERLTQQIDILAERIDQLEQVLDDR